MKAIRASVSIALMLAGCGITPVELGPQVSSDAIVVGDVPRAAIDELADSAPGPTDAMRVSFNYPLDATVLPENVAPIAFQWQLGAAPKPAKDPMMDPMAMMDPMMMVPMAMTMPKPAMPPKPADKTPVVSELHLKSARAEVRLYTTELAVTLPADRWHALLQAGAGDTLHIELRVLLAAHEIVRAKPIALPLQPATQAGALYLWSTTAQGILRAELEQTRAVRVAPAADPNASGSGCGGCHALSRDGRRMLLGRGSPARLDAYTLPAIDPASAPGELANADYGWASFDPTASRIALASAGRLRIFDADSGAVLAQAALADALRVTQPDWSPDGRFIALCLLGPDGGDDQQLSGSSIARVRVALDGSLGAPEVLVAPMGKDDTLLFPSYSPDGSTIAFEHAKGNSKEAKDATLFLVAADGGMPIALERLHTTEKGAPHAIDSMPTWLPGTQPGSDFLLFSSTRGYGDTEFAPGQEQLFASAIDGTLAAEGVDPSAPAFWLPFQESGGSYHRALFAPAQLACAPSLELCNGRDDDCDGQSDEDCCKPAPEHCGDGIDDDCDGSIDEGCECSFLDACGDSVDGDCDGKIDEDCPQKP